MKIYNLFLCAIFLLGKIGMCAATELEERNITKQNHVPSVLEKAIIERWSPDPEEETPVICANALDISLSSSQEKIRLNFYEKEISNQDLQDLQPLTPYIAGLNLEYTWLTDQQLHLVASLCNLLDLNLSNNCLTDEGVPLLNSLKKLVDLRLNHNGFTSKSLFMLMPLKDQLQTLSISSNKVGTEGAKIISDFNIQDLIAESCGLTDDCLTYFLEMPSLKRINIKHNNFTPDRFEEFKLAAIAKGITIQN